MVAADSGGCVPRDPVVPRLRRTALGQHMLLPHPSVSYTVEPASIALQEQGDQRPVLMS